jgi:hypothetical protein
MCLNFVHNTVTIFLSSFHCYEYTVESKECPKIWTERGGVIPMPGEKRPGTLF